jgi:hypothetical protein
VTIEKREPGWMKKICRTCEHNQYWHETAESSSGTAGGWCAETRCGAHINNLPYCTEFVPSDNLDYIEWLAEKRGLLK